MHYKLSAVVAVVALALAVAVPASAFDCTVAKKPPTAGAVGIVDVNTGEFTPLKKNPGTEEKPHGSFVALTNGEDTTSTFLHAKDGVKKNVLPGGPHDNCDGKGLDSIEQCGFFGG
jgi:hypothetical protein